MKLTGIKTIIWDLDNTLYKRNIHLQNDLREAEISVICAHTGWTRQKARNEFNTIHPSVFQSATETAAHLAKIPTPEAAQETEKYFNRVQYLTKDIQLIQVFEKLKMFEHFILTNGVIEQTKKAICTLGLLPEQFTEIVTSEQTGVNKPNPAGFLYIMNITGQRASEHVMIGDRDLVDIEPAKKLGMKTCFVWGESQIADVSIPTVYDVPEIIEIPRPNIQI
jgi:HAD superfamily hydrolase (TIGR01549 family)